MERERVTVQEAARQLGITESAVRKRAQRGQLRSEKAMEGKKERLYIFLDPDEDKFPEPFRERYIRSLEQRVNTLEDEVYRQQAILLNMTEAMKALSPPSQETPSEARESPETVEEEPERAAAPHPSTGGTQEDTERPQQRSGWQAPVDKLPWWQYALGLSLVFAAGFLGFSLVRDFVVFGAITLSPPGIFGFWVGYRRRNVRLLSQVVPLGAMVGGVDYLGVNLSELWVESVGFMFEFSLELLFFLLAPAWLLFVSASLLGNTWQRRRIERISGTTPASPVSRTRQGAGQQPRKDLTPTQQAILGWGGTIISAIITLVGTIIALRSGG